MIVLAINIIVVIIPHILRKKILLTICPVNNHQIVTGMNVATIVNNSIARNINPSTDSRIFILSDIKFYFYIITI